MMINLVSWCSTMLGGSDHFSEGGVALRLEDDNSSEVGVALCLEDLIIW